jgi:serine/threonine-protein kinase
VVAAGIAIAAYLLLNRTHSGTGPGKTLPPAGTRVVSVKRTSARDFDPSSDGGDGAEHRSEARLAVDRDPGTSWTTESYSGSNLNGKAGVGLYVDAAPSVAATSLELDTAKPGWVVALYVAPDGPVPKGAPPKGWIKAGGGTVRRRNQRFTLRTGGKPYRYYLLWITKLPPNEQRVELADVSLFAKQRR